VRLVEVGLTNVRNYASLAFLPAAGLNLFVGENAQGKSNLLEAIALLAMGKSFRTPREVEVIRDGESLATLHATAEAAAGMVDLRCTMTMQARQSRKVYSVNGHAVRYASYLGRIRIVAFTPEDLRLVNGPPQGRRALLNAALAQESPAYYRALALYTRVLQQKAALLRGDRIDTTLLDIYNERLIATGVQLILARRTFIQRLAEHAESLYHTLAEAAHEELRILYAPHIASEGAGEAEVGAAFVERLRLLQPSEIARRSCLVGPHRDDLQLSIDGHPLHAYGSQGQRRSAILALKLAEYRVLRDRSGEAPILLLDDVLSELDDRRQQRLLRILSEVDQSFLTTTSLPSSLPASASLVRIHAARLEAMAT